VVAFVEDALHPVAQAGGFGGRFQGVDAAVRGKVRGSASILLKMLIACFQVLDDRSGGGEPEGNSVLRI